MTNLKASKIYRAAIFFAVYILLLSGCAGSGQQREEQSISRRLSTLEQQQAALSRRNLGAQQKLNADTNIRLDNLEREMKLLSESVEDALSRPEEVQGIDKFAIEKTIANLETRLQKLEQGTVKNGPDATAGKTSSSAKQPGPTKKTAVKIPSAREKAFYDDAYNTFKRGNFKAAKSKFKKFIASFPKSEYKVNSQFWIGECYYKTDDFAEAIIKYDEIITTHPQHPKAPSALLKQGFAFLKLGDATDGKLILNKVIANYPRTDQAEIARRKLKTVK